MQLISTFSLTDREMREEGKEHLARLSNTSSQAGYLKRESGDLKRESGKLKRETEAWKSQHRGAAAAAKTAEGRRSQWKMEKELGEECERGRRRAEKEEEERLEREERANTRQLASEQVLIILNFFRTLCRNRQFIYPTFPDPFFRRAPGKSYLKQLHGDKRKKY